MQLKILLMAKHTPLTTQLLNTFWHVADFFQRVLLFICHGVGEHMGRYNKLAKHLAEGGVLVYGHDHGRSAWSSAVPFSVMQWQRLKAWVQYVHVTCAQVDELNFLKWSEAFVNVRRVKYAVCGHLVLNPKHITTWLFGGKGWNDQHFTLASFIEDDVYKYIMQVLLIKRLSFYGWSRIVLINTNVLWWIEINWIV